MILKRFSGIFILLFLINVALGAQERNAQESEQQIRDFSLAGFGEKGKKSWDLAGKSADIFADTIKLNDIVGNLYGEKENVRLTADKGDFDRTEGKIHLEQNVVITTSSGAKLTTDSLDWDRKRDVVTTKDPVNIKRENMVTTACGATGYPNLNQISLQKDVCVKINPATTENPGENDKNKIIITCDGPLQIDYQKNMATFNNNVKVDSKDGLIYSDVMDVYFVKSDKTKTEKSLESSFMGTQIEKIIARGNVKIVRGENVSYCDEAVYTASDRKVTLSGSPKLIIYSKEDLNASSRN